MNIKHYEQPLKRAAAHAEAKRELQAAEAPLTGQQVADAGRDRLRFLVAEAYRATYETRGGVLRLKTAKRREQEHAVARAVVRFAFDHGGYRGDHLAPDGLMGELLTEATERGESQQPSRE